MLRLLLPFICPFSFLVQLLGMTSCIVGKRTDLLVLILPFICPFFFLSNRFFPVKYYSGTTALRFLKHFTNVGYDLYCVKENWPASAYSPFICPFFLSFQSKVWTSALSFPSPCLKECIIKACWWICAGKGYT